MHLGEPASCYSFIHAGFHHVHGTTHLGKILNGDALQKRDKLFGAARDLQLLLIFHNIINVLFLAGGKMFYAESKMAAQKHLK
jgi:hypothetical protein